MVTLIKGWSQLIAAVTATGTADGINAAGWWMQDNVHGRSDNLRARITIAGMDDGVPELMDALPYADLSGQWADGTTVRTLYADHYTDGMPAYDTLPDWAYTEIGDAYETAYADAAHGAIGTECRALLAG